MYYKCVYHYRAEQLAHRLALEDILLKKVSKTTLTLITIAVLGLGTFVLYVRNPIPGEYETLATIFMLERQPLPVSCSKEFLRSGLLNELVTMAFIYKSYNQHEKAAAYFLRTVDLEKQICGADYPGLPVPLKLLADSYERAGMPEKGALIRKEIKEHEARQKNASSRTRSK